MRSEDGTTGSRKTRPTIELRAMSAADFEAFERVTIPRYAADTLRTDGGTPAAALDYARESLAKLLPEREATRDHFLYTVHSVEHDAAVGTIWIGIVTNKQRRTAYVFDVQIAAAHRRRGFATSAFRAVEARVRELGLTEIGLHLFGYNEAAFRLYRQLGYHASHISMVKSLTAEI
ncbi:GNAT family N-acetyltransferase [Pararobbsia silviterrae]|nr:GNAT family N-acetyltransferase [Pararobbsia silviterrae]